MHIPVVDPYEGITDEQIMKITIPCEITLGTAREDVGQNLMKMDQSKDAQLREAEAPWVEMFHFWMLVRSFWMVVVLLIVLLVCLISCLC